MTRAYVTVRDGTPMRAAEQQARIAGLDRVTSEGSRIEGVLAEGGSLEAFESCVRGRLGHDAEGRNVVVETGKA